MYCYNKQLELLLLLLLLIIFSVQVHMPEDSVVSTQHIFVAQTLQHTFRLSKNSDALTLQGQEIMIVSEVTRQTITLRIRIAKSENYVSMSGIHWLDYVYFHRYTFGFFFILLLTFFYVWKNKLSSVNLSVRNNNVFADRCPPMIKKTPPTPNSTTLNSSFNSSSPRSPGSPSPLRPFSTFEPVYGDPRGFYTPNARRNYSHQSP